MGLLTSLKLSMCLNAVLKVGGFEYIFICCARVGLQYLSYWKIFTSVFSSDASTVLLNNLASKYYQYMEIHL